jgi:hypothetical protein
MNKRKLYVLCGVYIIQDTNDNDLNKVGTVLTTAGWGRYVIKMMYYAISTMLIYFVNTDYRKMEPFQLCCS